jgi:hypothetical protein
MPDGYTHKKRIGWVRTDSASRLWRTLQNDNDATIRCGVVPTNYPNLASQNGTLALAAIPLGTFIPPTAVAAKVNMLAQELNAGTASEAISIVTLYPNNVNTATPFAGITVVKSGFLGSNETANLCIDLESFNLYWKIEEDGTDPDVQFDVLLCGWRDNL